MVSPRNFVRAPQSTSAHIWERHSGFSSQLSSLTSDLDGILVISSAFFYFNLFSGFHYHIRIEYDHSPAVLAIAPTLF
jgi:hypothetical protein